MRDSFLQFLAKEFPHLPVDRATPLVNENLFAEKVLTLSSAVLTQAQDFVTAAFSLRQKKNYQKYYEPELERHGLVDPGNYGFAMSYDFHLDSKQNLKLIEINTNAAFLAMSELFYRFRKLPSPIPSFNQEKIRQSFQTELELFGKPNIQPFTALIDEKPEEQRLFIEFLVYQEMFRSWGWKVEIQDSTTLSENFDLIYNRDTDFYFEKPSLQNLKKAWVDKKFCLSPHPVEYLYLADKQRLLDWNQPGFLEDKGLEASHIDCLKAHLPFARELSPENAEALWTERKNIFFKPKRSFGAKQSFRGASISRKAFDELIGQQILAQEFVPAPEIEIETPTGLQKMKYDLRFYAYQGQIQTVIARLYQGQVTNLRTPHGGFACVQFKN